jgi:GNAT superfamily N-acetyltransferase
MSERVEPPGLRQVQELQERAAWAVPAAVQEMRNGCWLRHTDSAATWWAGATLMHGHERVRDLSATIALAEDFYAAHGAPARFQVCPACPPELDDALARRGYHWTGVMSLQVTTAAHIGRRLSAPGLRVDLEEHLDADWLHLLMAAQAPGADPGPEWRLLRRVDRPSVYATAHLSGRPIAVGRAVADTGWTGVFAMATRPDARRLGGASAVLLALADWAASKNCPHMYLQVTHDSGAARGLYRRAGFTEVCTYHYRTAAYRGSRPANATSRS